MEYRYPKWPGNTLLAFFFVFTGLGVLAFGKIPPTPSSIGSEVVLAVACLLLLAFLLFGYFYLCSYYVSVNNEAVTIKSLVHAKTIAFSSIAQIVIASTPRGGTDSWLLSKDGQTLAKLDGSLDGFSTLLADLERHVRLYQATVFRRGSLGPWEWRMAGDTHWVPGNAPDSFRKTGRRARLILMVGYSLIAITAFVAWWFNHGAWE